MIIVEGFNNLLNNQWNTRQKISNDIKKFNHSIKQQDPKLAEYPFSLNTHIRYIKIDYMLGQT